MTKQMAGVKRLTSLAVGAVALAGVSAVQAQTQITRPIRFIVPYVPGGGTDTLSRLLGPYLATEFGQQVVIDNRAGGSSIIGTQIIARAAPDGQTVGMIDAAFVVNPSLIGKLPYDTVKDFTPIVLVATAPLVLCVHPAIPAKSVRELVALAKAQPGKLSYASTGNGSSNHISMELFNSLAGVKIVHIPYKGSAPAVTDLLGGQVQLMFDNVPNVLPHVKAGKLIALAQTGTKRSPLIADIPTVAEAGVPGYEVTVWFGLVAPAGTPREVVQKLNAETLRILAMPDVRERFLAQGVEPVGSTPEQFGEHIRAQMAKWAKVVADAGVKAE